MKRRDFLASLGVAAAAATAATTVRGFPHIVTKRAVPFVLPPLPYPENALKPVISDTTVGFHYGKHHKGYVDKLNELTKGTKYAEQTLEEIVLRSAKSKSDLNIFNNAAQVWNHNFYWKSLSPNGTSPNAALMQKINSAFGSFANFKTQFAEAAVAQFGTGWAWLVADKKGALAIMKTEDADNPLLKKMKPVLTIDVWEHAYYLDYQNKRADHVKAVIERLLNWDFAASNAG